MATVVVRPDGATSRLWAPAPAVQEITGYPAPPAGCPEAPVAPADRSPVHPRWYASSRACRRSAGSVAESARTGTCYAPSHVSTFVRYEFMNTS